MKAIIEVDVPDYQIGQEVSVYFKDTMMIKGVVQEPKTGRWLYDGAWHNCSECGCDAIVVNWKNNLTPYCPNCGAKMESEEISKRNM